jgi:hypothetical protein
MASMKVRLKTWLLLSLLMGAAGPASAYEVLENGKLRFGTGSEASVNANGNLQQPFYYDGNQSQWFKLTYSNYPLDYAVAVGGDGTNEWNTNGSLLQNGALTGQVLDVSGFTVVSGSKGYGQIVSTGTVLVGGTSLEVRNTYTLGADKSFITIVTRVTNTSGSDISNLRLWVGTRDDWVGTSDGPTKQRGNIVAGAFEPITNPTARAAALQIFSGSTGVLFYSTSPKAHTAINSCCSFSNAYNQNPATANVQATNDGSYALFVRMADLTPGASEEFTWYYAAGELADLETIVEEVAEASGGPFPVTATAGAGGTVSPASVQVAEGATTQLTVSPDVGYSIADVQGCGGSLLGETFTTAAITAACAVTASFSVNHYTVAASAGSGGTIGPASTPVDHGNTTTFAVTPSQGHHIAAVQGCSGTLNNTTYTTGVITADCTVTANFAVDTHQVLAAAGTGGTITPSSATVDHGATTSFTVLPAVGHGIATVSGCGGSLTGTAYTTGAIDAACTIAASFIRNTYTVSGSAGDGGSISPASTVESYGGTVTLTVTPETGYGIVSVAGCGGNLQGNTFTTAALSGSCAVTATFALRRPVFDPASLPDIELVATALFTDLPNSGAPRAFDFTGQELTVERVSAASRLAPGRHVLTWRTVDARGVASTVEQIVRIWPTVSLGADVDLGLRQGNSTSFRIGLNGASPVYPFVAGYSVSGFLAGHDLVSGTVEFAEGEVEKDVFFAITGVVPAGTPDQTVVVALDPELNIGARGRLTVRLIARNAAPSVALTARQDGSALPAFVRTGGSITILADVRDPNSADGYTIQWQPPTGASATSTDGALTLDASSLAAGVHRFEAIVTDDGTPALSTRGAIDLVLMASPPALPSGASAWSGHGLPDHPDYRPESRNVLPERHAELHHYLIEADAGVQLSLGPHAVLLQQFEAEVTGSLANASIGADTVDNVGGYFDFVAADLPAVGQSVRVVIPQRAPIPDHAVYRKFDTATQRWNTFAQSGTDSLASAPGAEGFCPPPGSDAFLPGLTPGDWCVELTLRDGGPNDSDHAENGVVRDPGGVGTLATVAVTTSGKGGGGAIGSGVLLFGALLLLLRRRRFLRPLLMIASSYFAIATASAGEARWYAGVQFGPTRSDVTESDVAARLADAGYQASVTFSDLSRNAHRVFGGYQLTRHLGIEGGFTDLGEVRTTLAGNVVDIGDFLTGTNELHPHSARGFEGSLVARYPLARRLFVNGRVGVLSWDARYRSQDANGEERLLKERGADVLLGAGVEFVVFRNWSLNAGWSRHDVAGERIDFRSLGILIRFR